MIETIIIVAREALNLLKDLLDIRTQGRDRSALRQEHLSRALEAFQTALRETTVFVSGSNQIDDPLRSNELAGLWAQAGSQLMNFNPRLGELAMMKSFSWSDVGVWSSHDRQDALRQLKVVEAELLQTVREHYWSDHNLSARPTHEILNGHYTMDVHQCPDISTSPNQCAVRLSRALIASGTSLDSDYTANKCRHGFARGAQDLAAFLRNKWGTYDFGFEAPGTKPMQLSNKKGVILFANIPEFDGQGHIDLWDGSTTGTPNSTYWNANPIWFWKLS